MSVTVKQHIITDLLMYSFNNVSITITENVMCFMDIQSGHLASISLSNEAKE